MRGNIIAIVAADCKYAVENKSALEDRLLAAFKTAQMSWITTDDEERFQGALVAVYASSNEEEKAKIQKELSLMRAVSAMLCGVPVDASCLADTDKENRIGIHKIWLQAKGY